MPVFLLLLFYEMIQLEGFFMGEVEHLLGEIIRWVDTRWPEVGDCTIGKKEMRFLRTDLLCF